MCPYPHTKAVDDCRPRRIEGRRPTGEVDKVQRASLAHSSPLTPPPTPPTDASSSHSLASARPRMAFAPRHFPPPALADVPLPYVLHQLRTLAPHYWNKPQTADCTIVIPLGRPSRTAPTTHVYSPGLFASGNNNNNNLTRRATEPAVPCSPPLVLKLHVDYLSAHSSLFRALFAGASPLHLIPTRSLTPALRPRVLPCTADHPKIFFPVPDPVAFQLLVHWCYFRSTPLLEDNLAAGRVSWDGLARTAAYLGMPREVRAFLAGYYRRYLSPDAPVVDMPGLTDDEFSEEEDEDEDDEDDEDEDEEEEDDRPSSGALQPPALARGRSHSVHTISHSNAFYVPPTPVAEVVAS